jgi:hypothetical protein
MINTRNLAKLRSSQPGELHAKETKNGEIVLYASKNAQGTGLKNFLFGTDKARRLRAEQAIADMVQAYEAGETPKKTIRFLEGAASPQSLRDRFSRQKLESSDGSGIRTLITNPRLRNIKALFLAYIETRGDPKALSTLKCLESIHKFEAHPSVENLKAMAKSLIDDKLPFVSKPARMAVFQGCQHCTEEQLPARAVTLKDDLEAIASHLSESLVPDFKLMNGVVRNTVSAERGDPDAVLKLLPPWVEGSDTGAVKGSYAADYAAAKHITDMLHKSLDEDHERHAVHAGATDMTLAKGFDPAAVHVTLDGEPMIAIDAVSREEALEQGYEKLLAFADGDKNVAEVLSRFMREETLRVVRDQLCRRGDTVSFIPVAMAAPKNGEPPAYMGSDGQAEVFDPAELSRFGGATWSLTKSDGVIVVGLEWYSYFDQVRSPDGSEQLSFDPMRLGIGFEAEINLNAAKQGTLDWSFTAEKVPMMEIDGYLPASST